MDRFKSQLIQCRNALNFVCNKINKESYLSEEICCNDLYNALYNLIPLIPEEYYFLRNRLRDTILPNLKLLDVVQTDKCGREIIIPRNGINPYSLGEVIATLNYLQEISKDASSLWEAIHIKIKDVAKCRFDNGHYADAVEAAFKEINAVVKVIYLEKTSVEKDGAKLMQAAFSLQNPIIKLADISTETGMSVQQGYMEMFTGAMKGIRNPKAHNNQVISKDDAIRKLHFASMLMYKLDNAII